jgi:LysR family nitrogen assimilation transcriptional regulator
VRLTPAGVTFYESAQRILAEATQMSQRLARSRPGSRASVTVGVSPTLARVLLPGLFEHCANSPQDVVLRSREAFTPALLDWLERGIIDMAVVTNPESGRPLALQPLLGPGIPAAWSPGQMALAQGELLGRLGFGPKASGGTASDTVVGTDFTD